MGGDDGGDGSGGGGGAHHTNNGLQGSNRVVSKGSVRAERYAAAAAIMGLEGAGVLGVNGGGGGGGGGGGDGGLYPACQAVAFGIRALQTPTSIRCTLQHLWGANVMQSAGSLRLFQRRAERTPEQGDDLLVRWPCQPSS